MAEDARLFTDDRPFDRFPRTRYQGSKRRSAWKIVQALRSVECETVLDAFGGTGAASYAFKCAGKRVTYNDILRFNAHIGHALIENDSVRLEPGDVESLLAAADGGGDDDFIARTFSGIYFTDEENRWLDGMVAAIGRRREPFGRSLAWFAIVQAAIAKRPYNLFHRSNLYLRTADVERGFGNKASWDRPFAEHFRVFAAEGSAAVIDSSGTCRSLCGDAFDVPGSYDLVYIDPPYINASGVGVDYHGFYHFLEGLTQYERWGELIDPRSRHRRLRARPDPWTRPRESLEAFRRLLQRFERSVLAVSYRTDGVPSIDDLLGLLRSVKPRVWVALDEPSQYVLSTQRSTREVLLIGA